MKNQDKKKMNRQERISYWCRVISSNPEYYLDTESYCEEDIYEYAVEMAENSEVYKE